MSGGTAAIAGDSDVRIPITIAWFALFAAPVALMIGHLGAHDLSWVQNQISTYAATAPRGRWITAGMLLAALSLLCLGISVSFLHVMGSVLPGRIASIVFGAAVSGLLLLVSFEETAVSMQQLKKLGFGAIRRQTFHDAGLLLFFYASTLAIAISGLVVILQGPGLARRVWGAVVAASGPAAYVVLTTSWPKYVGFSGAGTGVKQRAAFFCLWAGAALLLALLTKTARDRD